jgi:tetratricopeptide (TPR) repeat protein
MPNSLILEAENITRMKIFISYRRGDAAAHAGRLCDYLNRLIGADRIFMDVQDIAPGQRFAQSLADTMAASDAVLIVIGPRWAEILRQRAQEQSRDYVREEIEAALKRHVTIVPILVGDAGIEQLAGLPDTLAALSLYQVAELRDSSFSEDCARLAKALRLEPEEPASGKPSRTTAWIVAAAAAVLLTLGLVAIGPWRESRARKAALALPAPPPVAARQPEQKPWLAEEFATARVQFDRGEYESAFKTYMGVLKSDPRNRAAMDAQADAAMRWLENFHVLVPEGAKAEELAGAPLDQMMPVLDAALARTGGQGPRAANILAHLGWAHWLNQKLAQREFGPAAERDLRQALRLDPTNVFANAMMGNWMMQNRGSTEEALQHFRVAVAQNKERPLVRRMQVGVLVYPRDAEARSELIRVVNEMRRNGEALDAGQRRRILTTYDPVVNTAGELQQTLSAVPPADAWATYLWLDDQKADGHDAEWQHMRRDFIHAGILELEGKRQEALAAFQELRGALKQRGFTGRMATHVDTAITRLTSP